MFYMGGVKMKTKTSLSDALGVKKILPSGANMQFRMASPFGWYKTSVFWPVLMSHNITQPSTEDDAITDPFKLKKIAC